MKLNNRFLFSLFLFLIFNLFSLIFLGGCSKSGNGPDNDNTVTVSGKVTLEGESDHSGVTVSLYKPVELDTALVRINQQYPGIGVQISQETEFDHRTQTPVATTTTASDGSWSIDGVAKGTYNVVAEKEGWGWVTEYEQNIPNNSTYNLHLFPEQFITNDQTIEVLPSQHLVVPNNMTLNQTQTLILNGGSVVRFGPNVTLNIDGELKLQNPTDGYIFFINDEVDSKWREVKISNQINEIIKKLISKNASEGIKYFDSIVQITNSIFVDCNINVSRGNFSSIKNILIKNTTRGIGYSGCDSLSIEKNIFFSNEKGLVTSESSGELKNSYFYRNEVGVELEVSNFEIKNNNFEGNIIGFNNSSGSESMVFLNEFKNNDHAFQVGIVGGRFEPPISTVNQNNFFNTNNFHLYLDNINVIQDIDAQSNFFDSSSIQLIQQKIYDMNDNTNLKAVFDISNFSLNKIVNAGIQ